MKETAKVRMLIACFGLAVFFTVFSYRLIYLQVLKHDEYTALAAEKHVRKTITPSDRGVIEDIKGEIIAANKPIKTAVANATLVTNPAALADLLAKPLDIDRAKLVEMLSSGRPYVVLKKAIPESVANDLSGKMNGKALRGVWFEQDSSRIYPNGTMLCHVLGFVDHTHHGVEGIEKSMDDYLSGHDGFRYTERDRTGKEIEFYRGQERPPRAGSSVRLTIDMGLQNIVENELDAAVKQFRPASAVVILMKPQTGEILALANRPNFDLNAISDYTQEDMKDRAIADMVEPGSTFKIVTASAALNEKAVHMDTMIFCENGHFDFAGKVLRDHHGYGDLSVADILMKSSNIGAAKIAMMLGEQKFYEYIRRFGFGERTGIALPGEISGLVHPPHLWSKISISRIPMGQGVGVTPIQTVVAMAAVANGGHLMMPQIVHDIVDEQGSTVTSYPPVEVRQVMSSEVAAQVRDALKRVVSKQGTAALAAVAGFEVAGKTGTAQIPIPGGGGYYDDKYVASFEGFMPADNPAFVALVLINDPKTGPEQYYGGLVAAPVFSRIAEKAARYLNLEPHPEDNTDGKIIVTNANNVRLRMLLKHLLSKIDTIEVDGPQDREIASISFDSRTVQPGGLFVALRGEKMDGHRYIGQAVERGAVAVVVEEPVKKGSATMVVVKDTRSTLADLGAAFFHHPSHALKMAGITGTKGKTTVAFLLKHICEKMFLQCGLIGTVRYEIAGRILPAARTTPQSLEVHDLLYQMRSAGCKAAVMEVSSHALMQERVRGVEFDVAVFTNLKQDHLDYHLNMENYFEAKARLFGNLVAQKKKRGKAVINIDDQYGPRLAEKFARQLPVITYGVNTRADFRASGFKTDLSGTTFQLDALEKSYLVRLPLMGRFNIYNALAALAAASALGLDLRTAVLSLANAPAVPGRLEQVPAKRQFQVFVDYAHTEDSLLNVMKTLRELSPNRLIVVFGCGGNRDKAKRPLMGAAVEHNADYAIITSDNPRKEEPGAIIEDIKKGFRGGSYEVVQDRKEAIFKAISLAQPRDIILIAGKGHETYQEFADHTIPFDDVAIAKAAIESNPLTYQT